MPCLLPMPHLPPCHPCLARCPCPVSVQHSKTPAWGGETPADETAGGKKGRSRWDETPGGPGATPSQLGPGVTPGFFAGRPQGQ